MTDRLPVPLDKAYRLMNHGPTVLVSARHGEAINVMAAAWSMPLDFAPPKVAVVLDKSTLTRNMVEASGEFALMVPSRELAQLTLQVGSTSGREVDKFAAFGAGYWTGEQTGAPLLDGCLAWLECRLLPEPHIQDTYDLFLGQVVAAWADPAVFRDGHWVTTDGGPKSIHYVAGGHFFELGEAFEASAKLPETPNNAG
ncbi:flavin reductase family protein [Massilia oculi]|uniref:flavin reductase family protein n=1 Tax=Massilia oculi TaxID=945844 RepID=UPI0028B23A05|nr:flavin reductase family protein [Massilia oculi]